MTPTPDILALDFDGVICDGLIEYFQSAWQAYCQLFQPASQEPAPDLAEDFYALRPVIETGWEMPILLHGLCSGLSREAISADWPTLAHQLITEAGLDSKTASIAVDSVRDRWIQTDLDDWLSQHRFYPGVIAQVQQLMEAGVYLIIISTKEGRFIQQLLSQQGLNLGAGQILGKEVKQPKYVTLQQIQNSPPIGAAASVSIWFVEDRLKALELVEKQSDLSTVELFLADWGYNTPAEKTLAEQSERIHRLSLSQFTAPLTAWPNRHLDLGGLPE
ncbi:MAG: HAD family hydrolase [Cyanobacteria bacterium Co-bin8]|nr:HAD family hydrolase [Cyanobacteria bacterium Co-bin8]